ncbi:hypothetical protein [Kingella potus]|uniref:hypothetical protein n=1 Tax=Kingella potus TaxID=265175 RepID=UPI001FD5ED8F|nr:hypothetical protein [Kingella potus]UOP01974.1 hypothetical protein LVJ84_05330 [Kingella potus]
MGCKKDQAAQAAATNTSGKIIHLKAFFILRFFLLKVVKHAPDAQNGGEFTVKTVLPPSSTATNKTT